MWDTLDGRTTLARSPAHDGEVGHVARHVDEADTSDVTSNDRSALQLRCALRTDGHGGVVDSSPSATTAWSNVESGSIDPTVRDDEDVHAHDEHPDGEDDLDPRERRAREEQREGKNVAAVHDDAIEDP